MRRMVSNVFQIKIYLIAEYLFFVGVVIHKVFDEQM